MTSERPPQQNRAGDINAKTFDVRRAWLTALGTNDIDVLARRLSFDGASLETAPSHFTSLLSPEAGAWRSRFELWFENAPAIQAGRPPAVEPYPFADLWSGVADAAMRDLADRLPRGVAAYYQTDQAGWGRFEGVSRDIHSLIVSALSAVSEPVLWAEFNLRRTPGISFLRIFAPRTARPARSRAITTAISLTTCAVTGVDGSPPNIRRSRGSSAQRSTAVSRTRAKYSLACSTIRPS